ncbi:hypothetical protein ECB98_07780 [Brucellaceae bacterium VT-16-1752]|nr:hypothetical protein ECB98_07780 [Brucellaceae bacterium VT-16-1752]
MRVYVFAALAAFIFSLIYFQSSIDLGRLSHDISYDDIVYVNSGADRISILRENGPIQFLWNFIENPPHSPITILMSILSIILFGLNDYGFYILNFSILILLSIFLVKILNKESKAIIIWSVFLFLLSPMAYSAIENFKPDLSLGLLISAMVYFSAKGATERSNNDYIVSGICLGFALLLKPTFFPHTLAISITSGIICIFIEFLLHKKEPSAIRSNMITWSIAALIATPYYLIAGKSIFIYFWQNTQGAHSKIWSFPENYSTLMVLNHFLFNGYQRDGGYSIVLSGAVASSAIIFLIVKRDWKYFLQVAVLLTCAVASFIILVVGRHMNHHFFATFHALLLLSGTVGAAGIARNTNAWKYKVVISALFISLVVCSLFNHKFSLTESSRENLKINSENTKIAKAIANRLSESSVKGTNINNPAPVFVTVAGPVNSETVKWEARKRGVYISAIDQSRTSEISLILDTVSKSDFVIVPISSAAEYFQRFPNSSVQWQVNKFLAEDKLFERVRYDEKEHYALFARSSNRQEKVISVQGDAIVQGFDSEIGPFPEWGLPRVQWMTAPKATICYLTGGKKELDLTARSPSTQEIIISAAGKRQTHTLSEQFSSAEFTVDVPDDIPCINIESDITNIQEGGYLLFSRLSARNIH